MEKNFIFVVFLAVQVTRTGAFLGHETIKNSLCIDLNDVNSGNLSSQKDRKDKAFPMKNVTFRPKIY